MNITIGKHYLFNGKKCTAIDGGLSDIKTNSKGVTSGGDQIIILQDKSGAKLATSTGPSHALPNCSELSKLGFEDEPKESEPRKSDTGANKKSDDGEGKKKVKS